MKKLFSIIIPCYNSTDTICKALDSIMVQYDDDTEVIICDDRSTDDLKDCISGYLCAMDIRYLRTKDGEPQGPSNARNLGIRESEGEWAVFLDSDDQLSPNALEILRKHIEKGEENFIWCPFRYNFSTTYWESKLALQGKCFNIGFLKENNIYFNTELYTEEDYNFIMKVIFEIKGRGLSYTHDKTNVVCEHIENKNSMVHTISDYERTTFRYFVNGYSEPSLSYSQRYPLLRDFFLRESMFVFIMMYYRLQHIRNLGTANIAYYERLLRNLYKRILITYNIRFIDVCDYFRDTALHNEAKRTSLCDMGVSEMDTITEDVLRDDFYTAGNDPLFSIVIPCFNCANTISYTLDSILEQGDDDIEILICDDRSTDRFMDVVKRYNDRLFIRYFRTEDKTLHSPGNGRQVGLDNANGEWVIFIDSDDKFTPTALSDYRTCINNGACNMIWGGFSKGDLLYCHSRIALHGKAFNRRFLQSNNIRFNTNIFMEEDYEFIQDILYTIRGLNSSYYIWEKEFYVYTVSSENSSMASVGDKYFEKTLESYMQSRFIPLINAYLRFPQEREYFESMIYYTFFVCYFRYSYFLRNNDVEFMEKCIFKYRRYFINALSVISGNIDTILSRAKDDIYNNAKGEVAADMGFTEFSNDFDLEFFLKNIIRL